MFEELVKEITSNFTQVGYLLEDKDQDIAKAELILAEVENDLKNLLPDNSILKEEDEKKISELRNEFIEWSIKVSFASSYSLIDAYQQSIDSIKKTDLMQKINNKIIIMCEVYNNAQKQGYANTAIIDFTTDLSYLKRCLNSSTKRSVTSEDVIKQMEKNLNSAWNFMGTQRLFFSPESYSTTLPDSEDDNILKI